MSVALIGSGKVIKIFPSPCVNWMQHHVNNSWKRKEPACQICLTKPRLYLEDKLRHQMLSQVMEISKILLFVKQLSMRR